MADITVSNTDWSVISAVKTALAEATIEAALVFQAVTATTSDRQARQCQFTQSPIAIVRYLTTRELASPEAVVGCALSLELTLAARVDSPATDESQRLEEILRLVSAAKNAIHADPPEQIAAWPDGDGFSPALEFGPGKIDTAERQAWAVAVLPVNLTYVLEGPTSH